jgi:hypothetical protein
MHQRIFTGRIVSVAFACATFESRNTPFLRRELAN